MKRARFDGEKKGVSDKEMDTASLSEVEEELREVERALVRLEERREGLQERKEAILKVVFFSALLNCPALQAGLSSSDFLALVELHLRNMLATVEGMEEEEEVMLATMKGTGDDEEEEEEVGRLLLFHNKDTGILDISKAMYNFIFATSTWSKS